MDPSACLVYWPDRCGLPQSAGGNTGSRFLVGWNPRGTLVCIADIVLASHADEVKKLTSKSNSNNDFTPGLRVLGRIHRDAAALRSANEDGSKLLKQGDIWLELEEGPLMLELHCCGIRVMNAFLMVIHYTTSQRYSTTPLRINSVSRLGLSGAAQAISRRRADTLQPGAISLAEGEYLPSHVANLMTTMRHAMFKPPDVTNTSMTANSNPSFTAAEVSDSPQTHSGGHGQVVANESVASHGSSDGVNTSLDADDRKKSSTANALQDVDPVISIDPSVPPRLSFPTWASGTELSYTLRLLNQVGELQKRLRNPGHAPPYSEQAVRQPLKARVMLNAVVRGAHIAVMHLLVVVTLLARASYVMSTLEFKLRELLCCFAVTSHSARACGLHAFVPHSFIDRGDGPGVASDPADSFARRRERRQCLYSYFARNAADVALGFLVSAVITKHSSAVSAWVGDVAWWGTHDLHIAYIQWFQGWPAGFKSNEELNEVMGLACEGAIELWRCIVAALDLEWTWMGLMLLRVVSLAGFSFSVSFVADTCNLITLHIRTMLHIMTIPYRIATAIVSTLILQFRGKRRNPLRRRVDEWLFASDEMIIGLLVGTATLFVAPTVAMYYIYFAVARTVIWVLQETLRGVAMLAVFIPVHPVYVWLTKGQEYPSGVSLQHIRVRHARPREGPSNGSAWTSRGLLPTDGVAAPVVEADLCPLPMALHEAVAEFIVLAQFVLSSSLNPGRIIRFVAYAQEKPIMDLRGTVFAHLIPDPACPTLPLPSGSTPKN